MSDPAWMGDRSMRRIAFVVLTWNSEKCIERCLRSIYRLDASQLSGEIFVVDNHSSDQTAAVIQQTKAQWEAQSGFFCTLISMDKNYGTTKSRNLAIRQALDKRCYSFICILDSDTEVSTEAILTLIEASASNPECSICGPRMHDDQGVYQHSGRNIPTLTEKLLKVLPFRRCQALGTSMETSLPEEGTGCVRVGYLLSACWMMRSEIFERVGLLDEKIFYAPEDVEFCVRCLKAGYVNLYCYDADIVHEWQRLSRKKLLSKHNAEHIQGLIYMFAKHKFLFRIPKQWGAQ